MEDYEQAIDSELKALEINNKRSGKANIESSDILKKLADDYLKIDSIPDGIDCLERALAIELDFYGTKED